MENLIVVSNRLPLTQKSGVWMRSSGGLVSALSSLKRPFTWVGCLPLPDDDTTSSSQISKDLQTQGCVPVFLSNNLYNAAYHLSNSVLWPFLHHVSPPTPSKGDVDAYFTVNAMVADTVLALLSASPPTPSSPSTIWVQDYHMFPLCALLRKSLPAHTRLGFFLHTPFSSLPLVQRLPFDRSAECIKGVLAADSVCFHTSSYASHFLDAARYVGAATTPLSSSSSSCPSSPSSPPPTATALLDGHTCTVGVFPIGIDPLPFTTALSNPSISSRLGELKRFFGEGEGVGVRVIVSVARLDPIKGAVEGMEAFRGLLAGFEERHKFDAPKPPLPCFISVVVPSRENVQAYKSLKRRLEELSSEINSVFGRVGSPPPISLLCASSSLYTTPPPPLYSPLPPLPHEEARSHTHTHTLHPIPLHPTFIDRSISHGELCSILALGSVCFLPSLRDGLNLVAMEYVAVQESFVSFPPLPSPPPGVLVLSEFAGAAESFVGGDEEGPVLVNPHDREAMANALDHALYSMPEGERRARHSNLIKRVESNSSNVWAQKCLAALAGTPTPLPHFALTPTTTPPTA